MPATPKPESPVIELCRQLALPQFVNVDVGAGGTNALDLEQIAPLCDVHGIEPREEAEKAGLNAGGFGKYIHHRIALSEHSGPQTLYLTRIPEASSLLKPHSVNLERWRGKGIDFNELITSSGCG